ncbi:proline--tRNA ligase [bacterium]|nr:proline--tRNA ligase [bacterium]MBU3930358.1 proline--tRNA ligase [bacterium]MBU4122690.1 proline--tRNA ligase [bacterium]
MRYTKTLIPTMKEVPSDAVTPSHILMLRSGMIRKLASGIYEWLPLGKKALNRVEKVIRDLHDDEGCLEVLLPALLPKSLWEQTGRWGEYGAELMRLKDRQGREFCLAPTHEEAITELAGNYIKSYKDLPKTFYQIQTKYRDEIRPRFGVMRAREFIMKDAYSFDADEQGAGLSYDRMFALYKKICAALSLEAVPVIAKTGLIGGTKSHEFMAPSDEGEEELVYCGCGWGANQELAYSNISSAIGSTSCFNRLSIPSEVEGLTTREEPLPLEEVSTPGVRTVEEVSAFLKLPAEKFIKTLIYRTAEGFACVLVRGDHSADPAKLRSIIGDDARLADEKEIEEITGGPLGFSGPVGLKIKAYADNTIKYGCNMVSGANKKDAHIKNINCPRDFEAEFMNIRTVKAGDPCPECEKPLFVARGIEIGHTFYLGTKYSEKLKASFTDKAGKGLPIVMGCYGIGVSRIVAALISQNHDDKGIIWPRGMAPYQIEIIAASSTGPAMEKAEEIYKALAEKYEVLFDDRDVSAGIKFKDADLIGIPVRIVLGPRGMKTGECEIQSRADGKTEAVKLDKLLEKISDFT